MSSGFSPLLWRYIFLRFLNNFILMSLILMGFIMFFDMIELLRRAARYDVPLYRLVQMSALKLPELFQVISPFIILFSSIFTFWQFNRRYEATIFRSAGYSIWQFAGPVICTSFALGVLITGIVNPAGSVLIKKFNVLENKFLSKSEPQIALLDNGLWLRQPTQDGYIIMHSRAIDIPEWRLRDVTTLFFDNQDNFKWRIDAPKAMLLEGVWDFPNAALSRVSEPTQGNVKMRVETGLTGSKISETFADPETLSFWEMPSHIAILKATGFDPARLQVYYQTLLARPFLYAALVLIAACVSLRPPRTQATFFLIVLGVAAGFTIFFVTNFLQALGASHQIGIGVAAWAPILITVLFGSGVILSLEDG